MSQQSAVRPPRPTPMRGPGAMMSAGMPAEKSMTFWPSARRLVARLAPERTLAVLVLLLSAVGITLSVIGPKILGNATNIIFAGVIGKQLPAGITKEQAIEGARAAGQDGFARPAVRHRTSCPARASTSPRCLTC